MASPDHRPAARDGNLKTPHQRLARRARGKDQLTLKLSRRRVEAGVEDARIGAAGAKGRLGLSLEQDHGNPASGQLESHGTPHYSRTDDCHLEVCC